MRPSYRDPAQDILSCLNSSSGCGTVGTPENLIVTYLARECVLCLAFSAHIAVPAHAQQNGRFAVLKNQAFDLFTRGKYAEMAGKLEEVWEQDQSDAKVAEYLGMGYLYGERSASKARTVMMAAIALGGQATFLVQHSHEHLGVLNGSTMNQYCTGRISITPGKLNFIADSGEHSLLVTPDELKDFRVLSLTGRITVKAGKQSYTFRVKSQTRDEAVLLEQLAEHNLKK